MAKEEILIEWRDSREKRKKVACQWIRKFLKWGVWVTMAWSGGFLIFALAGHLLLPDDIIFDAGLWSIYFLSLAGIAAIVVLEILIVPTLCLLLGRYAVTTLGLRVDGDLLPWSRIEGYRLESQANEHGERVLLLLMNSGGLPSLAVPDSVSLDEVVKVVSARVPVTNEGGVLQRIKGDLTSVWLIFISIAYGIILGWLVGTFVEDHWFMFRLVPMVTIIVGPGSLWLLIRRWREVRRCFALVMLGYFHNILAGVVMMGTAFIAYLHKIFYG